MEEITAGTITLDGGLEGDHKGPKFPKRRITVLAREAWEEALAELRAADGSAVRLPWTARRANLLVEGVRLPRARGGILRIGDVKLEVTYPTQPCRRMEEAHVGLLKALHPDWRGGVTCQVLKGGEVKIGDEVEVLHAPPEHVVRLP
jgi:MOSC domain-containing protein YiiM